MHHLAVLAPGLGLATLLACSHAETVAAPTASNPPDAPTRLPGARVVTPKTEPGHPDLAASPAQLMAPGASDSIAAALRTKGFLGEDSGTSKNLENALRAFQKSQGLAETGFPDHETLRKLGIDPKTVDRTTTAPDAGR
jgi:peptidoglycan hydrolase-like protein with peptidoglycan-binding domain